MKDVNKMRCEKLILNPKKLKQSYIESEYAGTDLYVTLLNPDNNVKYLLTISRMHHSVPETPFNNPLDWYQYHFGPSHINILQAGIKLDEQYHLIDLPIISILIKNHCDEMGVELIWEDELHD